MIAPAYACLCKVIDVNRKKQRVFMRDLCWKAYSSTPASEGSRAIVWRFMTSGTPL
jgi:hypothetical protein